jgi:hypothetical protein
MRNRCGGSATWTPTARSTCTPARSSGHLGCGGFAFYDAAKLLPFYDKLRFENAVRDLTVYTKREQGQYELTEHAKKVLWIIIGPLPGHPEYVKWWTGRLVSVRKMREEGMEPKFAIEPPVPLEPASEEPQAEPKKRTRRKRVG